MNLKNRWPTLDVFIRVFSVSQDLVLGKYAAKRWVKAGTSIGAWGVFCLTSTQCSSALSQSHTFLSLESQSQLIESTELIHDEPHTKEQLTQEPVKKPNTSQTKDHEEDFVSIDDSQKDITKTDLWHFDDELSEANQALNESFTKPEPAHESSPYHQATGIWIGPQRYDTNFGLFYGYKWPSFLGDIWLDLGVGYDQFRLKLENPTFKMDMSQKVVSTSIRGVTFLPTNHPIFLHASLSIHYQRHHLIDARLYETDYSIQHSHIGTMGASILSGIGYEHKLSTRTFIQIHILSISYHKLFSQAGGAPLDNQMFQIIKSLFTYASLIPPTNISLGYRL